MAFDRLCLPAQIVQSCLARNSPLVSADYRELPQTSAKDILADAKDAYMFVMEKVPSLLDASKETRCEKAVVVG